MSQQQWKHSGNEGGGEEDVQMPLGVAGDAPVEEYSAPRGPRFNSSTLTLVAAFATAIAVLYLLGVQNKPRAASAEEAQKQIKIGEVIDKMIKSRSEQEKMGKLHDSAKVLMEILVRYFDGDKHVADLTGDPFAVEAPPVKAVAGGEAPPPAPRQMTSEALLRATQAFGGLRLQMVLTGARPSAMISDSASGDLMVTLGAHVQMWEVTGIQPGAVTLRFKDADGTATDAVLKQNALPLTNRH